MPLIQFWHPGRLDNLVASTSIGIQSALYAGYVRVRTEAWVYANAQPFTVPLLLFWHAGRQDNFVTATREGIVSRSSPGTS